MQHHSFKFDFRILEMGSYNVILGVDWMKTCNPVLFDFEAYTISFKRDGKGVVLQGIGELSSRAKLMQSGNSQQLWHKGGREFKSPLFCIQIPQVTEFATLPEEATSIFTAELRHS